MFCWPEASPKSCPHSGIGESPECEHQGSQITKISSGFCATQSVMWKKDLTDSSWPQRADCDKLVLTVDSNMSGSG